ncbi:OTUD4 [Symbiodinium microadriaticum]|nr:OTUD4 [Symbiodinium microadriaticum]CAE7255598.1 OTUD4 [Symbiodinium sp. KB8]
MNASIHLPSIRNFRKIEVDDSLVIFRPDLAKADDIEKLEMFVAACGGMLHSIGTFVLPVSQGSARDTMDDGEQMAADAEDPQAADVAEMDVPIQIFKATCIKGPHLKQPWLPDVQSVSGVDYIKLGKWDRDLTLFATGIPLNFAATKRRASHNINVIWFEDMKRLRQEACDSAVKKVIVEAAEAEGKPVPKRIRPAREEDQFLIGKTGSFGGQNEGVYGGFIWEDALDAGSHGVPMTSDDATHRYCAGPRSRQLLLSSCVFLAFIKGQAYSAKSPHFMLRSYAASCVVQDGRKELGCRLCGQKWSKGALNMTILFLMLRCLLSQLVMLRVQELLALTGGSHWPPIQGPVGHREKEEMEEQTQGEDSKIYALFRVPEADVAAFAALSGRDGFFIDPPRWTTFPAFSVQWAEKEAKETDLEFLQRVRRVRAVESKFGVVVGRRGLGKRIARDANQAIPRTWLLEHAPYEWGSVQAAKAVSTIFENVTMLRQQRTRKGVNFFFRAEHATEHDVIALPFEDGDMLWCRWAPVRAKPQAQTIRTNGSWSLLPRDPLAETTKVAQDVSQDDAEEVPANDASMEASSKQAPSEGKEAKRESTSKGKGVAKRVCTETRDLPKGVEQQPAPTDGSCLFHAASAAIAHILKCEPEAHSVLRAKVVQHFKKNSSRYEAMWDKELPDRSQGNSFQDYISAIAVVDTWAGPIELAALGRIYDIKFVIYPRSPDLEVCAVHVNQRKRVAALAFTGSHYEWLKPVNKLPQELCDVTTPPPQVPMRGNALTHAKRGPPQEYPKRARQNKRKRSAPYCHYDFQLAAFIRIATLNTVGKGISVVNEISNFMDSHNLQVCTVAEADINVASAPGYIRAWKHRGVLRGSLSFAAMTRMFLLLATIATFRSLLPVIST